MGKFRFEEQWVEVSTIAFIVLGFVISVLLKNQTFSYITLFVAGFLVGRIYYIKRTKEPILPLALIILGFLLGYIAGSIWASRILALFFFILGFGISYHLHLKEILVIFKSKRFIK